jgi:ribosomal protein S28E/S33
MEDLFSHRGAVKFSFCAPRLVALVFAVVLVSLGLFSPPAAAAADSIEIRRNLPLLLQTLDSLPYSKQGKGPVIYVIEFSTCGVARRFETEYGARLAGMGFEARRIYYGVDVATQNNAAASALSRDPAMQRAFMFDNRRAPSVYDTSAALAAYQDVPDKLNAVVAVLQQSGWRTDRVVSPMPVGMTATRRSKSRLLTRAVGGPVSRKSRDSGTSRAVAIALA